MKFERSRNLLDLRIRSSLRHQQGRLRCRTALNSFDVCKTSLVVCQCDAGYVQLEIRGVVKGRKLLVDALLDCVLPVSRELCSRKRCDDITRSAVNNNKGYYSRLRQQVSVRCDAKMSTRRLADPKGFCSQECSAQIRSRVNKANLIIECITNSCKDDISEFQ